MEAIIETKRLILRELTPDDRERETCIKTSKKVMAAPMTFCMGAIQILSKHMIRELERGKQENVKA